MVNSTAGGRRDSAMGTYDLSTAAGIIGSSQPPIVGTPASMGAAHIRRRVPAFALAVVPMHVHSRLERLSSPVRWRALQAASRRSVEGKRFLLSGQGTIVTGEQLIAHQPRIAGPAVLGTVATPASTSQRTHRHRARSHAGNNTIAEA